MKIIVKKRYSPQRHIQVIWRGHCHFCGRPMEKFGRYHENCRVILRHSRRPNG